MKLGISFKGSGQSQMAAAGALCALRQASVNADCFAASGLFSYVSALFLLFEKDEDIIKRPCDINKYVLHLPLIKRVGFLALSLPRGGDMLARKIKSEMKAKNISKMADFKKQIIFTSADIFSSEMYIYSAKNLSEIKNGKIVTKIKPSEAIRNSMGGCGAILPITDNKKYMAHSDMLLPSGGCILPLLGAEKTIEIEIISKEEKHNFSDLIAGVSETATRQIIKNDKWRADYKISIDASDIGSRDKNSVKMLFDRGFEKTGEIIGDILFKLYI